MIELTRLLQVITVYLLSRNSIPASYYRALVEWTDQEKARDIIQGIKDGINAYESNMYQ